MELINKLELRFNVRIPPGSEGKLFTIRDAVVVVEEAIKSTGDRPRPSSESGILSRATQNVEDVKSGLKGSVSKSVLQGVFGSTASVFMNTWLRVEAGLDNIPASGAYILASNHSSHLDALAIREALGRRARSLHVRGAKDYFFDTRLKSWFFSTFLNALPFDREENVADGLALCKTVLDNGKLDPALPRGHALDNRRVASVPGRSRRARRGTRNTDYPRAAARNVHGIAKRKFRAAPNPHRRRVRKAGRFQRHKKRARRNHIGGFVSPSRERIARASGSAFKADLNEYLSRKNDVPPPSRRQDSETGRRDAGGTTCGHQKMPHETNAPAPRAAAYFDVDGTLTATNSVTPLLWYRRRRGTMWDRAWAASLPTARTVVALAVSLQLRRRRPHDLPLLQRPRRRASARRRADLF